MDNKTINWNRKNYNNLIKYLRENADIKYKNFQIKLIPNIKYKMIGIRIPDIRKIANYIYKTNYIDFIEISKNDYFEEVLLKLLLIAKIKDKNKQIEYINKYMPLINNWALCDTFVCSMKCINDDLEFYYNYFSKFKNRITIVVYLNYYLIDTYIDRVFSYIENINTDDYYINMAISWLLSKAYINYKNKVCNYLDNCNNKDIIKYTKVKIKDSRKIKER